MKINAVMAPGASDDKSGVLLYTAFYGAAGTHPQAEMKSRLDLLMKDMRVVEH